MENKRNGKNWIIVLLIFVIPLGIFAWLETSAKTIAKEAAQNTNTVANHNYTKVNSKPKMLKFSSPMCSDCKKVSKELVGVLEDFKDAVVFEEINVSDGSKASNDAVTEYKVTVVPTLIFIDKDGKIVQKNEGFITEKEIRTSLNNIK